MTKSLNPLSFLFLFFLPLCCYSQKMEVERQVSPKLVPTKAVDFLNREYPGWSHALYYQEKNESGQFFEIKFKYTGRRYSVKFLPDGSLYDTERVVTFRELPQQIRETISAGLRQHLRRFRVARVQEQLNNGILMGYEIEIRGNSSGYIGYFEAHFDPEGNFKEIRRIDERPNDYLFF